MQVRENRRFTVRLLARSSSTATPATSTPLSSPVELPPVSSLVQGRSSTKRAIGDIDEDENMNNSGSMLRTEGDLVRYVIQTGRVPVSDILTFSTFRIYSKDILYSNTNLVSDYSS